MSLPIDAIYDQGVFRPLEPFILPEGTRVRMRLEEPIRDNGSEKLVSRIASPRLAHPEQAGEFIMEVREVPDAGV